MTRIAIIGHFGGKELFLDGQTVKTKILHNELTNTQKFKITKVDTYYKNTHPLRLLLSTIWTLLSVKKIIVLLSGNGMKFYFPLLYWFAKIRRSVIFHDVIGGNLDKYVERNPNFKKYLSSFKVNWVETEGLKNKLAALGVTNCEVIPNFKRLPILEEKELSTVKFNGEYRFCIFSRVMKEKGVDCAIEAIAKINKDFSEKKCFLDIYGSIDSGYKKSFDLLLKKNTEYVRYGGCIPFDDCVEVLKNYYCLLFPTYWMGEGFPGTIVDAFSSGVPVIASRWGFNEELVHPQENGLLFPVHDQNALEECIRWAVSHKKEMLCMRKKCIENARLYSPELYMPIITNALTEG